MITQLNGFTYKCVKFKDRIDFDDKFLQSLEQANSGSDPLAANYNEKAIMRMAEYGYITNESGDVVYMTGLEDFSNGIYRIESRTWINPKYRRKFWRCPDDYQTILLQINNHASETNMLFKSREAKNPAGFTISARLNDYFKDWIVYPEEIELKYKDNWQWIMYKNFNGDVNENLKKLHH